MLKLSYFELLSNGPVVLPGSGGILSPKLREIAALGIENYRQYLTVLSMDDFELFLSMEPSALLLQRVLNFFIQEEVVCSPRHNCFFLKTGKETTGTVTRESYPKICDVIFQRNNIKSMQQEDPSKIENKKASEIMKKLQKGRAKKAAHAKADDTMDLGNIISAVAGKSPSLNLLNIWDLTIFQLYDCFARLSANNIYDIQSMSVAAWGDKDHSFDAAAWFQRIYQPH